jgi:PAS domain S-box-containing protein
MQGVDLTQCESEPIHIPGAIQPNGALLVVHGPQHHITQASTSCEAVLGVAASTLLGAALGDALGPALIAGLTSALERYLETPSFPSTFAWVSPDGRTLSVFAHLSEPLLVLEFEPVPDRGTSLEESLANAVRAAGLVRTERTLQAKVQVAAEWLRRLTGYDRVMIYRFHADWHGEVIAEARRADLAPYLGLHYPASDIPPQARRLYLVSPTRVITDVDYTPAAVLPAINPITQQPVDLSRCILRSVSPVHLQYLRNMGVRATLVASVLRDGQLWGLISCHHDRPRAVTAGERAIADWMAQDLATQIAMTEDRERRAHAARLKKYRDDTLLALRQHPGLVNLLRGEQAANLLGAVAAHGVALVSGSDVISHGVTPAPEDVLELARQASAVAAADGTDFFLTDCLSERLPGGARWSTTAAGVGMFPIQASHNVKLLWFRGEQIRSVTWGGNPDKAVDVAADGRIKPRTSFAAWSESVRLRSVPWLPEEIDSVHELAVMIDIEFRYRAEQAEIATASLLKDVLDSLTIYLAVLDGDGRITAVNKAWSLATQRREWPGGGVGADYLEVWRLAAFGPDGSNEQAALEGIRALLSGERSSFELEYSRRSSTNERWFVLRAFRLSGGVPGAVVGHKETTAAKLAELALRETEARYRSIVTAMAEGVVMQAANGEIIATNPAAERILGLTNEQMSGRTSIDPLWQSIHEDGSPFPGEEHPSMVTLRTGKPERNVLMGIRTPEGRTRWISISSEPLRLREGEPPRAVVTTFTDVTQLREATAQLGHVLDGSNDGFWDWEMRSGRIELDRRWADIVGYELPELAPDTTTWKKLVYPEDVAAIDLALERHLRGEVDRFAHEGRLQHKDGGLRWVLMRGRVVERDPGGAPLRMTGTLTDITARKEVEAELQRQRAKLEDLNQSLKVHVELAVSELRARDHLLITQSWQAAMGEMLGHIAHQWRQPLNALGLLLANLRDSARFGELNAPIVERAFDDGTTLIQKMSSTINDFRNFFRPNKGKSFFSAAEQVRVAIALLESGLRESAVRADVEVANDLRIFGFPNEYSHAILNVLTNALQAIESRPGQGHIAVWIGVRNGRGCVTVRDDGGGIAPAAFPRLFEPYFTTKESGTGIGLYLSRQVIEGMGGTLDARNVEGGAEFTVLVPLVAA